MKLSEIIDLDRFPVSDKAFQATCRAAFDASGVFVMEKFLRTDSVAAIQAEGDARREDVFSQEARHTVYLSSPDSAFPEHHARNRLVTSSKGCLTDDQIPSDSPLRTLYDDPSFQAFLCAVLGEEALHPYADPLSSINLHFAETRQELGWHFDNSSFAITLMIQPPESGGQFEYVSAVRDADAGEMGYAKVAEILDGRAPVSEIKAEPGTLVLFRGRNALHRVAPNDGDRPRMLAVLAYNSKPGVSLSESARLTFYGRVA